MGRICWALISIAGKLEPDGKNSLRKATPCLFSTDERHFEKSNEQQNAVVLWTMHPWERDARFFKEALTRGTKGYSLIIEVACTRSSEELLGARKAYHSIFHSSVEEDVASHVRDEIAKSEAEFLHDAIKKNAILIEDDEIIRIFCTRSKLHLKAISGHYKQFFGKDLDEVLDAAMRKGADGFTQEALTQAIVSQADVI
ncbi:Annexin D4 [Bienertia sinuspersici]